MERGIYTMANDCFYNQFVALVNSIRAIYGKEMPVCVFPYDDKTKNVRDWAGRADNVFMFDDVKSMSLWEDYANRIWDAHPTAREEWYRIHKLRFYRSTMYRKFAAFDGPFERFIFMDADTLAMDRLDFIFDKLTDYDYVVYDTQYKHPQHVYNTDSQRLYDVFDKERIDKEIHCAGFFASKRGVFGEKEREEVFSSLIEGDLEILHPTGPDQTIINYMVMKTGKRFYNFSLEPEEDKRTGTCVVTTDFIEIDHILYEGANRLPYLHYIGIPQEVFNKVCKGENLSFPYRDLFLYYRYLDKPEDRPRLKGPERPYDFKPSLPRKILRNLKAALIYDCRIIRSALDGSRR